MKRRRVKSLALWDLNDPSQDNRVSGNCLTGARFTE
jgi:hypothetical protein